MSARRKHSSAGDFHHYLPIPDELLHGGFYVTSVGFSKVGAGESYPKDLHPSLYQFTWTEGRILPEFSLMLLTKGGGVFESRETGPLTVGAGSIVLLFPGVWHRYRPNKKTGWTEKWVHFNGAFAHQLLEQSVLSPSCPIIPTPNARAVERIMDRLLAIAHRAPSSNSLFISLQALGALAIAVEDNRLSVFKTSPALERISTLATTAVGHIWTGSHHVLSVPDVASALGVTRRTLERHVAEALGHTVLDEIIRCRFSRAERLLRETNLPIKTIVNLAGFGSMENMRQVFMVQVKLPPAAYRNEQRAGHATFAGGKPAA